MPVLTHSFTRNGISVQLSFPGAEDYIAKQVALTDDFYESDLLGAVGELLAPGDLVVDVGANVGNHTVFFALVKKCKVFSFEPNPAALLYLRANVLHNMVASLVHVKPFAVGESRGRAGVLSEDAGNLGAMSLKLDAQSGIFEVVSLDDQDFPSPVRLLKIDVEGMEAGVLRGAKALIERDRPYMVIEAGTAEEFGSVDSILNALRYIAIAVFGATATYLYVPAERYSNLSPEILIGIRNAVISEAAQKQLFLEHRETRKTVIKHSQQIADFRSDIVGLRPELDGRFIKAASDLQKIKDDIDVGMSSIRSELVADRRSSARELQAEMSSERGIRAEELLAAIRNERELRAKEVKVALAEERKVVAQEIQESLSAERTARIQEIQSAVLKERDLRAKELQEAELPDRAIRAQEIQAAILRERESAIQELQSALRQERERLMTAVRAEIDQECILREKNLRLELEKDWASRWSEFQAGMLAQLKLIEAKAKAELSVERSLCSADLERLRANIYINLEEVNSRISHLNGRHDALLNGRIFKTLTGIKSLVLRRKPDSGAVPMLKWTPEDEVPALVPDAAPSALRSAARRPDVLPVAERAGIEVAHRSRMERSIDILFAGSTGLADEPLVSIVMTTYNAEATVVDAVESILGQTYRKFELVIVDDASSDRTLAKLWQMAGKDKRIRIIESPRNRGTYWAKNTGIVTSLGEVVTFMDSDDVVDATRIEKQLGHIRGSGVVGTTCNYIRKNESGEIVLNRGLEQRIGLITLMLKRKVFDEIGYFDSVRTSADDEMMQRVKLVYGRQSVINVSEPLYIAKLRENSLTTMAGNANNLAATTATAFLSDARAKYVEAYSLWHKMVSSGGKVPYVPFPNVNRPFAVAGKLRVDEDLFEAQPIMAFMASFPPRLEKLKLAVASILPQVDRLYIYLNGFDSVPQFLLDERIVVKVGGKDLRDNGKIFHMANSPDGYYLTVDDDIAYPPDYCEQLVRAVERYDRKAVVGVHGVTLAQPFVKYFSPDRTVYSFKHVLHKDVRVNLLGTGTVAFHSTTLRPRLDQFESTGMADVWMAILAKTGSVPMISVARPANWLKPILMAGEGDATLYDEFRENDSAQTEILKRHGSWMI